MGVKMLKRNRKTEIKPLTVKELRRRLRWVKGSRTIRIIPEGGFLDSYGLICDGGIYEDGYYLIREHSFVGTAADIYSDFRVTMKGVEREIKKITDERAENEPR